MNDQIDFNPGSTRKHRADRACPWSGLRIAINEASDRLPRWLVGRHGILRTGPRPRRRRLDTAKPRYAVLLWPAGLHALAPRRRYPSFDGRLSAERGVASGDRRHSTWRELHEGICIGGWWILGMLLYPRPSRGGGRQGLASSAGKMPLCARRGHVAA